MTEVVFVILRTLVSPTLAGVKMKAANHARDLSACGSSCRIWVVLQALHVGMRQLGLGSQQDTKSIEREANTSQIHLIRHFLSAAVLAGLRDEL